MLPRLLVLITLSVAFSACSAQPPPARGYAFPPLKAPVSGIAELHISNLLCFGRTGVTSFERSAPLSQQIHEYDTAGQLVRSKYESNIRFGTSLRYEYVYEGGQLKEIVTTSDERGRPGKIAVSFQGDTIITVEEGKYRMENKYLNGNSVSQAYWNEAGELIQSFKTVFSDRGRRASQTTNKTTKDGEEKSSISHLFVEDPAAVRSIDVSDLITEQVIIHEPTPNGRVSWRVMAGVYEQVAVTTLTEAEVESARTVNNAEEIKGGWRSVVDNEVLVVIGVPITGTDAKKYPDATKFLNFQVSEKQVDKNDFDGYFRDGKLIEVGLMRSGQHTFRLLGNKLLWERNGMVNIMERAPRFAAIGQGEYGAQNRLPEGLTYVSPGWYRGLKNSAGKEVLSPTVRIGMVLNDERFLVTTSESSSKRYGLTNDKGDFLLPLENYDIKVVGTDRLLVLGPAATTLYDFNGKEVFPSPAMAVEVSSTGLIKMESRDGDVRFYDQDITQVHKKSFSTKSRLIGKGYGAGESNGRWTVFDPQGKELFGLTGAEAVHCVGYNTFLVHRGGDDYDLMASDGKAYYSFTSNVPGEANEEVVIYWKNGKCGLISAFGEQLTPAEYDLITLEEDEKGRRSSRKARDQQQPSGYAFSKDGKKGVLDPLGRER